MGHQRRRVRRTREGNHKFQKLQVETKEKEAPYLPKELLCRLIQALNHRKEERLSTSTRAVGAKTEAELEAKWAASKAHREVNSFQEPMLMLPQRRKKMKTSSNQLKRKVRKRTMSSMMTLTRRMHLS